MVDVEAVTLDRQNPAVSGNPVANSDGNDISRNQFICLDACNVSVAYDLGLVGGVFLEGGNSLFGAGFLRDSDDSVEDENGEDLERESVSVSTRLSLVGRLTTAGSTNAVQPSSSSKRASAKDTAADPSRMITSWSLNCSRMSSQMGVGGSSGSAVSRVSTSLCAPPVYEAQRTILAVLFSRAIDLLCAETLLFLDLEMPQRLSGRLDVCILHAHRLFHR